MCLKNLDPILCFKNLDPIPGQREYCGEKPGGGHHPPCVGHCAHLPDHDHDDDDDDVDDVDDHDDHDDHDDDDDNDKDDDDAYFLVLLLHYGIPP